MDIQSIKILNDAIQEPIEMVELISSGHFLEDTTKPVVDVGCHPGTPIVISLKDYCVSLTCASAGVRVDRHAKQFDLNQLFFEDLPIYYDDDEFAVRIPIYQFLLDHPIFDNTDWFIDTVDLIDFARNKIEICPAAIVLTFETGVRFGLSAVCESSFRYFYNEQCTRLVAAAARSQWHSVTTLRREAAKTRDQNPESEPAESLLWLVE